MYGFRMGLPWGFEGVISLPWDAHGAPVNGPHGAAVGIPWVSHSGIVRMGLPRNYHKTPKMIMCIVESITVSFSIYMCNITTEPAV